MKENYLEGYYAELYNSERSGRKMGNNMEDRQNDIIESFQSLFGKEELLAKVIEFFPYPIQIYAPDGTSVLVNKAMLAEYHAISGHGCRESNNVFKDPDVIATGQVHALKRAFHGEIVFFSGCQSAFGRNCGALRHTGLRCGGRIPGHHGFPYSG